jgi:NADPH-dependent curcumin reductase CurA
VEKGEATASLRARSDVLVRETCGESNMSVEGSSDTTREVEFADVVAIRDAGTVEIEGASGSVAVVAIFAAPRVAGLEFVAGSGTEKPSTWVRALRIE